VYRLLLPADRHSAAPGGPVAIAAGAAAGKQLVVVSFCCCWTGTAVFVSYALTAELGCCSGQWGVTSRSYFFPALPEGKQYIY